MTQPTGTQHPQLANPNRQHIPLHTRNSYTIYDAFVDAKQQISHIYSQCILTFSLSLSLQLLIIVIFEKTRTRSYNLNIWSRKDWYYISKWNCTTVSKCTREIRKQWPPYQGTCYAIINLDEWNYSNFPSGIHSAAQIIFWGSDMQSMFRRDNKHPSELTAQTGRLIRP